MSKDIVDNLGENARVVATGSHSSQLIKSLEIGVGRFTPLIYGVLPLSKMKNLDSKISLEKYFDFSRFPIYRNIQTYNEEIHLSIIERAFLASASKKQTLYKALKSIVKKRVAS